MWNVLSADILDLDHILLSTSQTVVQQGRRYYERGQVEVERVDTDSALINVFESPGVAHQVVLRLHNRQIFVSCTCPQRHYWTFCRHRRRCDSGAP
jgi:non-specific serine/threonine protein kinase